MQEFIKKIRRIKMKKRRWLALLLAVAMVFTASPVMNTRAAVTGQYTNPMMNGADPTIVRGDDGYYYSGFGTDNDIYIKRSDSLLGLSTAESHLVWDNPRTDNPSGDENYYVWGPYIYRIDGAWYIYYSSSTENDFGYGHPSCYVLENTSVDPFEGEWVLKGKNTNVDDFAGTATEKDGLMNTESYGLACGVISIAGEQYFTYTKYEYYANEPGNTKFDECPTIVKMENPWTLTGPECTVARPTYDWELHGDNVNEGCALVEHEGKVYFAYSASSFTNDNYCVGLSVCDLSTDVMDENNWKKSSTPIMSRSDENSSFGPGSPLFVKSPDETEDWLIYHGGPIGGQTSTDRRVRAQIINWTDDGQINLGVPSNPNTVLDMPSGEIKSDVYEAEDAAYGNVSKQLFNNTAKASGSGYMKFDCEGTGYIEFTVDADVAGMYTLGFRYNNTGDTLAANLTVNGGVSSQISFPKNGEYSVNLDVEKAYNVALSAGANTIRLSTEQASKLAVDTLIVTRGTRYEAEAAAVSNGAEVKGNYVEGMFNEDATVKFTVNVPSAGYYAVNLGYADGHSNENGHKYATIYVNDAKVKTTDLFPTGSWSSTGERIDNIYLMAGENTIAYVNHIEDGKNTADVNYDYITITEAITNTYQAQDSDIEKREYQEQTAEPVEQTAEPVEQSEVTEPTGDPGTDPVTTYEAEDATTYEAEDAKLFNGAFVEGEDHVGGMFNGFAALAFDVEAAADGVYQVDIKYANGNDQDKKTAVYVNGEKIAPVDLPITGPWNTWNTISQNLELRAGTNTIAFVNNADDLGAAGDVNYDSISVHDTPLSTEITAKEQTVRYEAEFAQLSSGIVVQKDNPGFSGSGFAGGMFNDDATVTYKVAVPETGKYRIKIGYASGSAAKVGQLSVNGQFIEEVELPKTENWQTYATALAKVDLTAGVNTISLANKKIEGASTGDVNYDYLEVMWPQVVDEGDSIHELGQSKCIVNVESEAIYDVTIQYAAEALDTTDYILYINDVEADRPQFANGENGKMTLALHLNKGMNTIDVTGLSAAGTEKGLDITSMHLSRRTPWAYQAENSELSGVSAKSDQLYYDGTGYVGDFTEQGSSVQFLTNLAYSGTHTISLRYATLDNVDTSISLYVNGQKVKQIALTATADQDTWAEESEEVYLRAGKNIVEYKCDPEDTGAVHVDELIVDKYSTGDVTIEENRLISGEVYVLKDKNSGLSADIDGYSPDAGKEVYLWHYLGNNNQKWKLVDLGNGYWSLKGTYGSKRISLTETNIGGITYHTTVTADENKDDLAQQWKIEKVDDCYKLINRKFTTDGNEMVLSVVDDSKAAGAKLCVAANEGKDSQLFHLSSGLIIKGQEVVDIQNKANPVDYAVYGNQYELLDPVIPEGFDPYVTVNDGNDRRYDAANGRLENGAVIETNHEGYKGSKGYVGGMFNGSASVTFAISVDMAGNYPVTLGYCNGFGANEAERAAVTYVNGEQVDATALPKTGNWDTWGTTTIKLDLVEGVNKITFKNELESADGLKGDVNYDYIDVCKYPDTVVAEDTPFTVIKETTRRYETEDGVLSSGAALATDHSGYSGEGFVGNMYNGSAKIACTVTVEEAGTYTLDMRYANGHGANVEEKKAAVLVNGRYIAPLEFPKTGNWDTWGTTSIDLTLNAGTSTITFVNSSSLAGAAGDVNYDYIDFYPKVEKHVHVYGTLHPEVPATHIKTGMKAYYYCEECQKYFTKEKVETTKEALTIAKLPHKYGDWKSNEKQHWHECSCGYKTDVAVHVYNNNQDSTCNICGYKREIKKVEPVMVKKISITCSSKKIAAGKKVTLKATVSPKKAANAKVKWTTSNKKVATVSSKGVVTFKKRTGGKKVTITATAVDGSKVKNSVTLTSVKGIVQKVTVSGASKVKAGKSVQLKAKVKASKGAYKKVTWSSSNTKYAVVNSKGKVTAKKAGKGKTVRITAKAVDGSGKKSTKKIKITK
jgi:GH43 family beta-xylosidase/uncharacterized protein YjdB